MASQPHRLNAPALTPTDSVTIFELAEIFGITPAELVAHMKRGQLTMRKPFYSFADLQARWCCSEGHVRNILRDSGTELLDFTRAGKSRGKHLVRAVDVERIEKSRMHPLAEEAA